MTQLQAAAAALLTMLASVGVPAQEPPPNPQAAMASPAQEPEARFDVTVENAPAQPFFQGLVEGTHYNILVQPEVTGRISLNLKHVTLEEVLQATRDLYGYDYRRTAAGFLILSAAIQSRVFHLSYLNLKRMGVSNTRISSGQITQGGNNSSYSGQAATTSNQPGSQAASDPSANGLDVTGTSVLTRADSDFWTAVEADLRALIGTKPGRNVIVNRQSGVIIVHAMSNELRDVADYLQQTSQTVTRQVVLEAKIIEVDLNDAYQAGINWSNVFSLGNSHYSFGQSTPPGGFAANPLTPTNTPVVIGPGSPTLGTIGAGVATNTLGGAFTIAAEFNNFATLIELLSAQGRTRVLSSPRVSTLHNQQAIIKAGNDEFFVTNVLSNTVTGTATSTSRDVQLTPFFSGVALDVTPQIGPDDFVTLHIHPTISEVTDQTKTLTVDGSVDTIPLALSQIRESDSIVRARSGQLVVIGGLMREELSKTHYKTPLLGDIPAVGKLFRSEQTSSHTVELVILLRPIVVGDNDWPTLVGEPAARLRELNKQGDFGKLEYPPTSTPASPTEPGSPR
jgi:MSHA biogenesis protein MshL